VFLFYRSQPIGVPMQRANNPMTKAPKARFEEKGIKLAGISYESEAILKIFR